ncbi:MAG: glycosyltransferase family 1 protein [Chlamydiales bacterium]|nr:glycosyltransferase family 1 protein [Chlamydiales bacterium]
MSKFVRLIPVGKKPAVDPNWSYAEIQRHYFTQKIAYSDSLTWGMQSHGFECEEIIYDFKELQMQWAKEHNFVPKEGWQIEIALAQLQAAKPKILFLQDIYAFPSQLIHQIKERVPSIERLIIFRGYPGFPPELAKTLSAADLLLVGSPILLTKCQEAGLSPHMFYHYFDPRIVISSHPKYSCVFCGSSGLGYSMGHASRYFLLKTLLQKGLVEAWLDEKKLLHPVKVTVRNLLLQIAQKAPALTSLPIQKMRNLRTNLEENKEEGFPLFEPVRKLAPRFPQMCHPPLFGLEMYQKLAEGKIVLNKHANCAKGTADNIRLFQATGVGSCLLTDKASNMSELFEEDKEIVTYASRAECEEKIRFLLDNAHVRQEIARAGQKRTLRDHTVTKRCEQLTSLIEQTY